MSLRTEKVLVALVLLVVLGGGFFALAEWVDTRSVPVPIWLVTPLDSAIPLLPSWVWVYLSWYPATALVLLANRENFRRAYVAYTLTFAACVVGYVILPITIARPFVAAQTGISEAAVALLYAFDPPTNLFPSFHAAIATILALLTRRPRLRLITTVWAVMLCIACLCTRQHYVLDVVGGIAAGALAIALTDHFMVGMHFDECAPEFSSSYSQKEPSLPSARGASRPPLAQRDGW